jgi:hypothetical protein
VGREAEIVALLDRQDLYELLIRYARGMDRHDKELVQSVFHPDATQNYNTFRGKALDFVDFVWSHGGAILKQHLITNWLFELRGDIAYGESYLAATYGGVGMAPLAVFGRYVDRFERREGVWRIADRRVTMEWIDRVKDSIRGGDYKLENFPPTRHDRTDISYERLPTANGTGVGRPPADQEHRLQVVLDKHALHRLLIRYTRGIDRWDKEFVLSVFHPDAHLHHNNFKGRAADFFEFLFDGDSFGGQHVIMNELFDVRGDVAFGESYLWSQRSGIGNPSDSMGWPIQRIGRYVDRFERRAGEWRIADRRTIIEWLPEELDEGRLGSYKLANFAPGFSDRRDPSYER